jgi:hypothetical protein
MENILHTIRYIRLIVRLVYLTQVLRIEADYWLPLTAQDGKMLEGIQWYGRKMSSLVAHV